MSKADVVQFKSKTIDYTDPLNALVECATNEEVKKNGYKKLGDMVKIIIQANKLKIKPKQIEKTEENTVLRLSDYIVNPNMSEDEKVMRRLLIEKAETNDKIISDLEEQVNTKKSEKSASIR